MLGAEKPIEHWDKRPNQPVIVRCDQSAIRSVRPSFSDVRLYLFAVSISSASNNDLVGHITNRASIWLDRLQWRAPKKLRR